MFFATERGAPLNANVGHLVTRNYMRYTVAHDSRLQTQGLGEVLPYWVKIQHPGTTRRAAGTSFGQVERGDNAKRYGAPRIGTSSLEGESQGRLGRKS